MVDGFNNDFMNGVGLRRLENEIGSQDLVNRITVVQPKVRPRHEKATILYHRATEEHKDAVDQIFDKVSVQGNRLPVHLHFEGSVQLKRGKIVDVDRDKSCVEIIHATDKGMTAAFNKEDENNWKDIRWTFYDNNRSLYWVFPENWKSELNLKDLKICSTFDFHAILCLKVKLEDESDTVDVEVVIDSRPIDDASGHCVVKQLLLQWG